MTSRIHLSEHFNYGKLLRFTLPSIVMNVFLSLYIIVDGFFVANFVGKTEFAAINLITPVLGILGAIGYMFGVGGSVLLFPLIFGLDGIWYAIVFAELMAAVVGGIFMVSLRKKYQY